MWRRRTSKPVLIVCLSPANVRLVDVLERLLVPENRQRAAVTDARIARRAEDRDAVLPILLVGVGHAELFAELVAEHDVGLRELEIEVVVAGARIEQQTRREHMHPAEHRVLGEQVRRSRERVLVAEADGLRQARKLDGSKRVRVDRSTSSTRNSGRGSCSARFACDRCARRTDSSSACASAS